ncbi:hypothetical protein QEK82_002264 [Stenotrophomonas maltophilia]|uniref:hypothetical protein n=1 Tax=Stenotrophomonas maltophilia group sp. Smal13 TaxID=3377166 RepID=UPI001310D211|nr:hypothetical protein [Stenotrophomonas maltophilia]EKU9959500.1 hypothetical protein [Stenotrophomonas maltophilia]EKU9985450.1 hypothetical protein [Stenotrophomonas maltophilia]
MNVSALPFGLTCMLLVAPLAQASPYVDLIDYPHQEANWDRFFALEGRLQHGFDAICGDTFCEGEYSDIRALRLRCSVDAVRGTIHECLWAFAASDLEVSRNDGAIVARQPTWLCRLPLVAGTPVEAFHAALAAGNPLHDPLPGTSQSVYDGLTGCIH